MMPGKQFIGPWSQGSMFIGPWSQGATMVRKSTQRGAEPRTHESGPSGADCEARNIGQRLRYHRETVLRASLRNVARRAGAAENTLRALEAGKANMGLHRLLETLREGYRLRNLAELLSLPRSPDDEQPAVVWKGPQGLDEHAEEVAPYPVGRVEYFLLKARASDPQMEVAIVRLPEGVRTTGPLEHKHGGDEILMGLKGTTEVVRQPEDSDEPEVYTIGRQQLILHRASVTHYARNASRQGECIYMVIRAPYGLTWPTAPPVQKAESQR